MSASQIRLIDSKTGAIFPAAPDGGVLRSSADLGWRGITVELHRISPFELPEHYIEGHRLLVNLSQPVRFEWKERDRWQRTLLKPGEFCLQTHRDFNFPRWHDPFEFCAIALDPSFIAQAFQDTRLSEILRFQTRRGNFDPIVADFARRFQIELASGSYDGALYGESLAIAFALYLIETHSDRAQPLRKPPGRLGSQQLKQIVEYIHEHLSEEFSLTDLSQQLNLSSFHFARLFKNSLGLSPHQYVLQNRIERAKQLIAVSAKPSLTEISVQVGFFDQAHFTKVFKRVVGMTPKTFFKQTI